MGIAMAFQKDLPAVLRGTAAAHLVVEATRQAANIQAVVPQGNSSTGSSAGSAEVHLSALAVARQDRF